MKKLLIALAVVSVGCSGQSLVGPTATSPNTSSSAASGSAPGNAGGGAGSAADASGSVSGTPTSGQAPRPEYTVQGPLGCVPAGTDPMQWLVNVTDAGPSQLRFVALAHNAMEPGCAATVDNPRSRVSMSGVTDYPAHTQGQTLFGYDPRSFSCGRVQVDVSAFDTQGRETLMIGMVVNYGTVCQAPPPPVVPPPPPPPPPVITTLQCAPGRQTVALNQSINLTATGGNGVYAWIAGGQPAGNGRGTLAMAFSTVGEHTVTVTSAGLTATCVVVVEELPPPPPPVPQLVCTPATSNALTGQPVPLQATGGTGQYTWTANAGSPANGTGAAFSTQFATTGTHAVTVTSGQQTATCTVAVTAPPPPPPPPVPALVCTPATSTVEANQSVALQATGGTGSYSWTATGGTPANGTGAAFSTAFATAGSHTVLVTSGQATATCVVTVNPPPVTPLFCSPDYVTTTVGQPVTVRASGGNNTYSWYVFGGTPDSGTGAAFTTRFTVAGSYRIYVRSATLEGKCRVEVAVDDDRPALTGRAKTTGQ